MSDLELLETATLTDLLASLANANAHLKQSNADLRSENDRELDSFAAENDDLIARQEETMKRAKQVLHKRIGLPVDNPHYALHDMPVAPRDRSEPGSATQLTTERAAAAAEDAGVYL